MKIVKTVATSAIALVAMAAIGQSDQPEIRVVIDGDRVHFSGQQPEESGGRVMVPLRGVFEKLGAKVDWNPSNQTITAHKQGMRVRLAIGELDASVNGSSAKMDVPATVEDGTTMVPLRFVSEALGAFVNWDQANHEVDITSSTDYDLPKPEPPPVRQAPPPPPVIVTPPPPAPIVVDRRPVRIVNNYREVPADTILPLRLETSLSSKDSKPGDPFTAVLETRGEADYAGLPAHTQVFGTVLFVRRQVHRDPGVIQLRFDQLVLPNGRKLPVNGKLSGMDEMSAMRVDGGRLEAKNPERNNTMVFVANGPETALIASFQTERPLGDGMIHNLLAASLDASQRTRLAYNAELPRGTRMGLRLYDGLVVPRD